MERREYVIGNGAAPNWCRQDLREYQKVDGSVGYELTSGHRIHELNKGDKIIRQGRHKYKCERTRHD